VTTVAAVDVLTAELPFRFSFGHALAERTSSTNVYVRVWLEDGTVGYGEGVPREYVTGETVEGAVEALNERLVPEVLGRSVSEPDDVPALLAGVPSTAPDGSLDTAARCALELAVLDAAGHRFGCSVQHWLGNAPAPIVEYDAVLPFSSPKKLVGLALAIRALGIRKVKIKVGADLEKELRSLELLRRVLGPDADLRVDANCAWTVDEALAAIERMRPYGISSVEQPLPGDDHEGLRRVTAETAEAIILDESLRTVEEARTLAETGACDAFNIRVSKCGGLLPSMEIAAIAREHGLDCVVGAQVGESGILSAAGRHCAAAIVWPRYVEGSGGRLLLREDLTAENVLFGRGGRANTFTGPGLGVRVREDVLARHTRSERTLAAEPAAVA
jgi:L-alanine-DL-glutamate epimerase-like enolase superfamily enzyme